MQKDSGLVVFTKAFARKDSVIVAFAGAFVQKDNGLVVSAKGYAQNAKTIEKEENCFTRRNEA